MPAVKPIILVRPPIEILLDRGFWDELADVGIDEVMIQWLALLDDPENHERPGSPYPQPEDSNQRGLEAVGGARTTKVPVAAFEPTPGLYQGLGKFQPPEMPQHMASQSQRLKDALAEAAERGFRLYFMDDKMYFLQGGFGTGQQQAPPVGLNDPELPHYGVARIRDTGSAFPSLSGVVLDGPDFKWEITPGHRDDMFATTIGGLHDETVAQSVGTNCERVRAGRARFHDRLRSLSPETVEDQLRNRNGVLDVYDWWDEEPRIIEWMRFKHASVEQHLKTIYNGVKGRTRLQIGASSRTPALAPLTGHHLRRKRAYTDFQLPKLYLWPGGVAGFRGTVMNWMNTLIDWNPRLTEDQATRWLSAFFGVPVPPVYPISQWGEEAPEEWFQATVADQVDKMLSATGGPERLVPWVGLEHFGSTWLTPQELRHLLSVMQARGVQRYSYFVYNSTYREIWGAIADFARGEGRGS
ncbi:MAG: hypothetical protein ACOC5K_02140 [Chloroflexota bacterium]